MCDDLVVDRGRRLVGADRTVAAAVAGGFTRAETGAGPAVSAGHSLRPAPGRRPATPAAGNGVRLRVDLLATSGPLAEGWSLRAVAPDPACRAACGRQARLDSRVRGRITRPCEKGGAATGPSPVDRRKTGSKHHLICDGRGIPLHVITTAANVNDITQTLNLVDGIPPVAGRPGRPRRRPESVLGDKTPHQPSVASALPEVLSLVKSSKALANWEVALGTGSNHGTVRRLEPTWQGPEPRPSCRSTPGAAYIPDVSL